MDPDTAIEHRLKHPNSSHLDKDVISALDFDLRSHYQLVKSYQMLREFVVAEENRTGLPTSNVVMRFYEGESTSNETGIRRPFAKAGSSVPVSNEIAYITTHNDGEITNFRDIIVYPRGKKIERIDTRNARCDAFSYVLLHLDGKDLGWDLKCSSELKITLMKFYAFRLANREGSMNQLLRMGNLTGQYIIDCYMKVEGDRLKYIRTHQDQIRAETYSGIHDFLQTHANENGLTLGRKVILPSTFIGSTRHMYLRYLNSMSLVQRFGKPDLFITVTTNPRWPDITQNLHLPDQDPFKRWDLLSRVFRLKLHSLLHMTIHMRRT
jgi:hypothetical protein